MADFGAVRAGAGERGVSPLPDLAFEWPPGAERAGCGPPSHATFLSAALRSRTPSPAEPCAARGAGGPFSPRPADRLRFRLTPFPPQERSHGQGCGSPFEAENAATPPARAPRGGEQRSRVVLGK